MNPIDEHGLYGMYPVWHTPFWRTTLFYVFVAACGALVVGVLGWFAYKKWFARKHVRTLWEQALFDLTALDTSGLETIEQRSQLYADMIKILKRYLQQRYDQSLAGKTDDELLAALKDGAFPDYVLENVRTILRGSVMIRFAREDVAQNQMERDMLLCMQVVKKTIPEAKNA